ncbi:MAG: ankyrin repeat domain-containing protein [Verrucomicrobia subdivision 3 bacterium]|nr:ankyrin repeat domain-containing protein [Limisphaerales bacterium]
MATVSRGLPERPHLDIPKREARELLDQWRKRQPDAFERIRRRHPKYRTADDSTIVAASFRLSDAQLVIAREYGFAHWTALKQRVEANSLAHALDAAVRANDRDAAVRLIQMQPQMLHVPVVSGNWGPPMSHAANLGRLEIIKAMAALGARDFQHAFDRATLQGRIECARWLLEHGAKVSPGAIMGACETLNADGFRLLAELNAPFTDKSGDRLAPLAMVLETYGRNPKGKHEILEIFAQRGYGLPDTPMLAFHRGDVSQLEKHLRRDPQLIERRFTLREIYPPQCGCATDDRSGMHWTPIQGTTLLHLAIDFREQEIFEWLLAHDADVNARATIDSDGFGGHTPLFNAVLNGPWPEAATTRRLLERGAAKDARASLRKFLDWTENPRWHKARDVTAAEWARGFPEQGWVNTEALPLLG